MSRTEELTIWTVFEKALDIFGSHERAQRWLSKPNLAMGGEIPNELLDSVEGLELVFTILNRIDYGLYS